MLGITDGSHKCECHACIKEFDLGADFLPGIWVSLSSTKMIICGTCGNKRCPKASNHRNECTASNNTGQVGSVYKQIE